MKKHFFQIDNHIMDAGLPPIAFLLYCHYVRVAGMKQDGCWKSLARLSKDLGLSKNSVIRYRQLLIDKGLIEEKIGTDGYGHQRIYISIKNTDRFGESSVQNMNQYQPVVSSKYEPVSVQNMNRHIKKITEKNIPLQEDYTTGIRRFGYCDESLGALRKFLQEKRVIR